MGLGVSTAAIRGHRVDTWVLSGFKASEVFNPSPGAYYAINKDNGYLYAFGDNTSGKLGIGVKYVSSTVGNYISKPYKLNFSDVKKMVGGPRHVILLLNNGELYGAGYNGYGQLGIGTSSDQENLFVRIDSPFTYLDVSCSMGFTIAVKSDNTLWGWGRNIDNIWDNIAMNYIKIPIRIGNSSSDWSKTFCADSYVFALNNAGELYGRGSSAPTAHGNIGTDLDIKTDFTQRCGKTLVYNPTVSFGVVSWPFEDRTYTDLYCTNTNVIASSDIGTLLFGQDDFFEFGLGLGQILDNTLQLLYYNNYNTIVTTTTITNIPATYDRGSLLYEYSLDKPSYWDIVYTNPFQGRIHYPYNREKTSYAIPLTLGSISATLVPQGIIKRTANTTIFLKDNNIYACGDLRNVSENNNTFDTRVPNARLCLSSKLSTLQGTIKSFDISKHATNHFIVLDGNDDIYIAGNYSLIPLGGARFAGSPLKAYFQNTSITDFLKPSFP